MERFPDTVALKVGEEQLQTQVGRAIGPRVDRAELIGASGSASVAPADFLNARHQENLRYPKPVIQWDCGDVWATVRCPECPVYSEPVGGHGWHTGCTWRRGQQVQIYAVCHSPCGNYVSALTGDGGWINIWCLWNTKARARIGCDYCSLTATP